MRAPAGEPLRASSMPLGRSEALRSRPCPAEGCKGRLWPAGFEYTDAGVQLCTYACSVCEHSESARR